MRGKRILVATAAALAFIAAPALAAVIGTAGSVTYSSFVAELETNDQIDINANCSAAKNITGIGFEAEFLNVEPQVLTMLAPNFANILARAAGDDNLTAYTMCTSAKIKYVTADKTHPAVGTGKIKVECPGRRHVIGGGVDAGSSRLIESTYPFDSKDDGKKPDDGWKASTSGLQEDTVVVTAACSKLQAQYPKQSTMLSPSVTSGVVAACKEDLNLASVGAHLTGPIQYGSLNAMRPRDDGDAGSVPGDEVLVNMGNDGSNPDSEKLTGYAICIP